MIRKFLHSGTIIQGLENQLQLNYDFLRRGYNAEEEKKRIEVKASAERQANKKQAPRKINELASLLDLLWNLGAFKGIKNRQGKLITYEQAVDGKIGNMTRLALANARQMGHNFDEYDINERSGLVISKKSPAKKITVTAIPELKEVIDPYTGMPMNIPIGYGDSNLGNGYSTKTNNNKTSWFNRLYQFGYDNTVDSNRGALFIDKLNEYLPEAILIPREAGGIYGTASKVVKGTFGMDEAAKASNEFASLDLSDPDLRKRAEELLKIMHDEEPRWGVRSGSLERKLKVIRGRYDLNQLHSGYPQKYNSYVVNETFTPNGYEQAYVLSDSEMRLAYRDFVSNFIKNNKPTKITQDGKRIYSVAGGDPYALYGNFTIVTDADGSNARYIDDWDFGVKKLSSKHYPGMKEIIISDKVL